MKQKYFESLMIEPTNICDFNCPLCPTGNGYYDNMNISKSTMSFEQFYNIVDPVKDFLKYINLWGFGEPFLAPDIMKMINYIGENNIYVKIDTNGNNLTSKKINQLKKNHKVSISFSIDGLTQETYSYYRRGGNLKKVLNNLSCLIDLKNKKNLNNLRIIWQFLIMKTNEHEVEKVRDFAKNLGVDILRFKIIGANNKKGTKDNSFVPKNKKYSNKIDDIIDSKCCIFINPGMPTILQNGDVVVCCRDSDKKHVMGNVFKNNLIDIWNGSKYIKFRRNYKKGMNDICNLSCKFTRKTKMYIKEFDFSTN